MLQTKIEQLYYILPFNTVFRKKLLEKVTNLNEQTNCFQISDASYHQLYCVKFSLQLIDTSKELCKKTKVGLFSEHSVLVSYVTVTRLYIRVIQRDSQHVCINFEHNILQRNI